MKQPFGTRRRQQGLAVVEFAVVGAIAITLILAVLELSRAYFVASALTEATRRGARMAAVCPINDPAVAEAATFNVPGGGSTSPIVRDLDTSDFILEYLDANGAVINDPNGNFNLIRHIRVRVVNFQHQLLIPPGTFTLTMPEFVTTLPRESLGVPRSGVITPC